ncbi:hypothetical protein MHSWG343_10810 [Candidatus Mycoplasma haematohominis]|uniref:Uncharacterized protein n=1 Tax=Candidatus Mycoplasma haematohominis TaxID=1494318 RepID=A0A478FRD3_9MOLU|nr:hypothetical protein MHSWG343_10810 [Candidatus Mycoplasma haemohominis]
MEYKHPNHKLLTKDEIKNKLGETNPEPTYKNQIKNNLSKMTSSVGSEINKPQESTFTSSEDKSDEISQFTHKWCEVVSQKKKTGSDKDKPWLEEEIKQDSEFDLFQKICFKQEAALAK